MAEERRAASYRLVVGGVEVARASYVLGPGEEPPPPEAVFTELLNTPVTVSVVTVSEYVARKRTKSLTFEVHVNTGGTVAELAGRIGVEAPVEVGPAPPGAPPGLQSVDVDFGALTEVIRSWAAGAARGPDIGARIIDRAMDAILGDYPIVGPAYLESRVRDVVVDVTIGEEPPATWPDLSSARWSFRHGLAGE